jgi:hypothetical protein
MILHFLEKIMRTEFGEHYFTVSELLGGGIKELTRKESTINTI